MKMDDSVQSGARLDVSVSFGRFENDALSWEKWSSFSPNKYLEEVGTLSTPGSVAQKKAYFEAHYKKIAAKKAEELEKEKLRDSVKPSPDLSSKDDPVANSSENGTELVEEVAEGACMTALNNVDISDEANNDDARSSKGEGACTKGASTNGFVDDVASDEGVAYSSIAMKCESSAVDEAKDISNVSIGNSEVNVRKDEVLVVLETPQKESQHISEEPPERKNGIKQTSVSKKEAPKLNARNIASKVTRTKKEGNFAGTEKKAVPLASRPSQASTPKYAKPILVSTHVPTSETSKKKVNGSAPPKSKSSQAGESKRAAPTSLHMSLSLGPTDSLGALSMNRKSLIMERMGDKDIIKRAFKTFQNRTINGTTTDEKPSTVKNVSSSAFEPKMSSYHTPAKGNEGLGRNAEKRSSQRSQLGTRSNPLPSRSNKSSAPVMKSTPAFSPAASLKSDEKAEKRKEFLKKLGAKSMAREAKNAQHGAKSKVSADALNQ